MIFSLLKVMCIIVLNLEDLKKNDLCSVSCVLYEKANIILLQYATGQININNFVVPEKITGQDSS